MNSQIVREITDPEQVKRDIEDVFVFNAPQSREVEASCQKIQTAIKQLALAIVDEVPEGRERTIALNNLLSAALFSRHGLTKRQVAIIAVAAPENT